MSFCDPSALEMRGQKVVNTLTLVEATRTTAIKQWADAEGSRKERKMGTKNDRRGEGGGGGMERVKGTTNGGAWNG
jgi:hypothetical protein